MGPNKDQRSMNIMESVRISEDWAFKGHHCAGKNNED